MGCLTYMPGFFPGIAPNVLLLYDPSMPAAKYRVQFLPNAAALAAAAACIARTTHTYPGSCLPSAALPQVLVSRSDEIRTRCSLLALVRWQGCTAGALLGMLREVPLHGPGKAGRLPSLYTAVCCISFAPYPCEFSSPFI
jgi:hypothetical protein